MAQTFTTPRWKYLPLLVCFLLGCVLAKAQVEPYLLLQGPGKSSTYRFQVGDRLEWALQGETELFTGVISALYPESQAIRIGDMLLSLDAIAQIKHARRGKGFKDYLRIQGGVNLIVIGIASLTDREQLRLRRRFTLGAALTSAAMITLGSINRYATRKIEPGGKYVLAVGGGDLRFSDDPERPSASPPPVSKP